jgi:signal peptidase II
MKQRAAFFLIAGSGALLDYATKFWAFRSLGVPDSCDPVPHTRIDVIPGWAGFRASMNPGIVWGLFQGIPDVFTVLAALAVPLIILLYWRTPGPSRLFTTALGLILAGALGNLYDRVFYGRVRDFIDVYVINYPIFNVADSWICIGVGLLAWHLLFCDKPAVPGTAPPVLPPDAGPTPEPP